jgi:hypothetical protein
MYEIQLDNELEQVEGGWGSTAAKWIAKGIGAAVGAWGVDSVIN